MTESAYTVPGAPRLALLSDLHGRPYQEIVSAVRRFAPEMICITGDLITGILPEDEISPLVSQPYVLPFLEKCAEIAPAFVSLGNHEQVLDETDLRKIEQTGVTVLDNRWVRKDKWIVGGLTSACVTDYRKAKPKDSPLRYPKILHIQRARIPETGWLDDFAGQEGFHILLSHQPEYYPFIPNNIELMLSGHAHGGQIRLFGHGLFAPGQGWWPELTSGVHDGRLVISRGLSNTAPLVPRLFNPTQIVYLLPGV
jgi:predicted MPP superfamily phosphohydrolase